MKKLVSIFFFLICFVWVNAQSSKVLFIGNSYTSVNNLPDLVSQIYTTAGETFDYTMSAPGGCTFQQHCSASLPYIQQGDWSKASCLPFQSVSSCRNRIRTRRNCVL